MTANQLFIIDNDAWQAASPKEVQSICADLRELGLYSLPYEAIDIAVSIDCAVRFTDANGQPSNMEDSQRHRRLINGKSVPPLGPDWLLIYKGVRSEGEAQECILTNSWGDSTKGGIQATGIVRDLLISLLATRNIKRTIRENKLAKLGIGKKKALGKYRYVTTISPPKEADDDAEHPAKPGAKKCPHLRRGYIRRQHFGPKNQQVKQVWVSPCFVNASEDFVAQREAYNLTVRSQEP